MERAGRAPRSCPGGSCPSLLPVPGILPPSLPVQGLWWETIPQAWGLGLPAFYICGDGTPGRYPLMVWMGQEGITSPASPFFKINDGADTAKRPTAVPHNQVPPSQSPSGEALEEAQGLLGACFSVSAQALRPFSGAQEARSVFPAHRACSLPWSPTYVTNVSWVTKAFSL